MLGRNSETISNFRTIKFLQQFSSIFAPDKIPAPAELRELWQIMNYNDGKRNYAKLIRYIQERKLHESEWLEALRTSLVPLKLLWGQQDPVAVSSIGLALHELRPDAELIELAEAGHYPQLEVPEIVLREMRNFFVEPIEEIKADAGSAMSS